MRLREILHIAKTTELKQIVVGEDEDYVLSLLNLALIEVYGKLNLIQEEQIIPINPGQTRYLLQDNTLRILQAFDQDGNELPINDPNDPRSIFHPTPYELHVTEPNVVTAGESPYNKPLTNISLIISTTPPYIAKDSIDLVDLVVPPWLLEPILAYMAYRAFLSMNGDQNGESASQFQRYMATMNAVVQSGYLNLGVTTNLKLNEKGFV